MKQLTLKDLYDAIKTQIEKGNGDKIVLVADDDEGNGYHPIYYSVTEGETFDEEDERRERSAEGGRTRRCHQDDCGISP